jgi:hypothetical protein
MRWTHWYHSPYNSAPRLALILGPDPNDDSRYRVTVQTASGSHTTGAVSRSYLTPIERNNDGYSRLLRPSQGDL